MSYTTSFLYTVLLRITYNEKLYQNCTVYARLLEASDDGNGLCVTHQPTSPTTVAHATTALAHLHLT